MAIRRRGSGHYGNQVYHVTARTHARFGLSGLLFAVAFAVLAIAHSTAFTFVLLAALVLVGVFYATSFARGFSDEDEA